MRSMSAMIARKPTGSSSAMVEATIEVSHKYDVVTAQTGAAVGSCRPQLTAPAPQDTFRSRDSMETTPP